MLKVKAEQGEASGQKMQTLAKTMTDGTQWHEIFLAKCAWRRSLKDQPEEFFPTQAKSHKD